VTRVSIVTISFNQARYLERTILSVLNQDYPEIEYIVVDPGSTDGSRAIIEQYRPSISKVILRPDQGAADGLNNGFSVATGEIFGFLNSDDLLLPGAVSSMVSYFDKHSDVDVVSGHGTLIGPDDRFLRRLYSDRMSLNRYIHGGVILIQPSTFFRRALFDRIGGFSVGNRVCWDSELFLEMARAGGKFAIADEFWSGYRVHQKSVTNSESRARRVREAHTEILARIKGRRPRGYEMLLREGYRILRHILNPKDTWERILRGPVSGRAFDI